MLHLRGFYTSLEDLNIILEATAEQGALFLGSLQAAADTKLLAKHNIKAVLTVAAGTRLTYRKSTVTEHMTIEAQDIESYNIARHFEKAIGFIEKQRSAGHNVLVHCYAGVSRSAAVTIAYLMKTMKLTYERAHEMVRSRRRIICPNSGFKSQLREYERRLRDDVPQADRPRAISSSTTRRPQTQISVVGRGPFISGIRPSNAIKYR
eukprot:TRINITY_DN22090_c0_g1_i1.p1 TRINITY_DN22090_c0_g1~~TRINITY_DN22090_c0_g1_i1.p1  ORF type:complete len:207 (+),score=29.14 TRINITY_DN22090_c0_g1_i1:132-752(+)